MYSKILVAVDESDTSRHALQQAIELAKNLSAALRLVHVVDMSWLPIGPEVAIDVEALRQARYGAGKKVIAAACDAAKAAGFEAETVLAETEAPIQQVAEVIVNEASRWGADLVVMGTHGRRGLQRLMLGSVAERVTRLSTGPVFLVPLPEGAASG